VHVAPWPVALPAWDDPTAREAGAAILNVVDTVRRWKAERQLSVGSPLGTLRIVSPPAVQALLAGAGLDLQGVTRAQEVVLESGVAGAPVEVIVEGVPGGAVPSA
jgi:valyl-tRNA synthetase